MKFRLTNDVLYKTAVTILSGLIARSMYVGYRNSPVFRPTNLKRVKEYYPRLEFTEDGIFGTDGIILPNGQIRGTMFTDIVSIQAMESANGGYLFLLVEHNRSDATTHVIRTDYVGIDPDSKYKIDWI